LSAKQRYSTIAEYLLVGSIRDQKKEDGKMRIKSSDRMSNSGFHRSGGKGSGRGSGAAYWWLRGPDGFVELPERVRGDDYLEIEIELSPGEYVLGVGRGKDAIRENIKVG